MAETVLAKMAVEISANAANFIKSLNSVDGKLKSFSSGLKDVAGTVGIAFGVSQVASFAFEVAKLAGEAEGVRAAFERLPESEALMSRLKDATAGTVSELELMKRTVQATNFGISLESLPQLLEFAAVRAQQTGQSVDYLVDSIVTGIGRKSPLILDNLGISAVALKEKMGGVSIAAADIGAVSEAVGKIASEELEKMGGFSENTATKIARLSASWDNFKVVLGNVVTAGGILEGVLTNLTGLLSALTDSDNANFIQFQKNLAESIKNESEPAVKTMIKELNLLRNELKTPISESFAKTLINDFKLNQEQGDRFLKIVREINGEVKKTTSVKVADPIQITTLESLQEKVKQLNELFATTDVNDQKRLANIGREIIGINEQIKKLEELRKARKKSEIATPNTVDAYQAALTELNKELENTNVKDTERIRILSAQIAGYQQAIANVERLKKSFQGLGEIVITPPDLSGLLDPLKTIKESAGALTFETQATAFEQVVARFEAGLDKLATKSVTATEQIKGVFIDMAPFVTDAVSGVAEALGRAAVGAGNFGQDILKIVAGFAGQLGKILIATGVGMIAAKKLITNPYTAIIAGALLVGLAAAANASIGSAHSKSFSGVSSGGGGAASATSNVSTFRGAPTRPEDRIQFNVDFKAKGTELVAVINNTNNRSERTG